MDVQNKNLNFTRWVYEVNHIGKVFIEFRLESRLDIFSTLKSNRYYLAIISEIEPFKYINSNTKGANLYFRSCYAHDPKDETALFPTKWNNIFYGDIRYSLKDGTIKKVLVFFHFVYDEEKLIIDVFDDYYTKKVSERNNILSSHPWYIKKAPEKSALKSFKTLMAFNNKPHAI